MSVCFRELFSVSGSLVYDEGREETLANTISVGFCRTGLEEG